MSIVVLESWVCGTPVLLTDQCGIDQVAEMGGGETLMVLARSSAS